jgi:hypothetical protein
MNPGVYIEVFCQQKFHEGQRICGDVFLSKKIGEENRLIAVLSDGMGHGIKANILATLTATMALNFTREHKDFNTIAELIMNTLPVCAERKTSYSTFTIVDIELHGETSILEYGNPQTLVFRGDKFMEPAWQCILLQSEKNAGKELRSCRFQHQKEDRVVVFSDGIPQSGTGSSKFPFGWGIDSVKSYVTELISRDRSISAGKLSTKIVNAAFQNDNYENKDDTSAAVLYFREPRKLLMVTGPPIDENKDEELYQQFVQFKGKKIICGATTADILARVGNIEITGGQQFEDPDLPPSSTMEGADLVTEGILTLNKVHEILKKYGPSTRLGKGPADKIVKLLKESDEIHVIIGTKINDAHQDPSLPVELEIRRTVVKRITRMLEEKFLKETYTRYI